MGEMADWINDCAEIAEVWDDEWDEGDERPDEWPFGGDDDDDYCDEEAPF